MTRLFPASLQITGDGKGQKRSRRDQLYEKLVRTGFWAHLAVTFVQDHCPERLATFDMSLHPDALLDEVRRQRRCELMSRIQFLRQA